MKWHSLSLDLSARPLVRIVEHLYLPGMDHTGEARGLPGSSVWPQSHPGICDSKKRTVMIARNRVTSRMADSAMDE